jgi:16S rRNA (uracil1498-N3)-methyltransferase
MESVLSGIELYYTDPGCVTGDQIIIEGEDVHHIINVMRHAAGDQLYVTDGTGRIYRTSVTSITKSEVKARIEERMEYENRLSNITFCLPRLKSADRFEFALEKCVELGVTSFIIFQSSRTIAKGAKLGRWNKIARAAMKQSLRCYLPRISFSEKFEDLNKQAGIKILFDQNAGTQLSEYIHTIKIDNPPKHYFVFGPEGGLTEQELNSLDESVLLRMTENRLRSETAAIAAAVYLNNL